MLDIGNENKQLITVELQAEGIPVFAINEGGALDAIIPVERKFEALAAGEWDVFRFLTLAKR